MPPGSTPYLRDFVLPPPFSAIVAILIAGGMARVAVLTLTGGERRASGVGRESGASLDVALGFVVVVAVVAALAHAVAWANLAPLVTLRAMAAALILANIGWCNRQSWWAITTGARRLKARVMCGPWIDRWILGAATFTLAALVIAASVPPTDADSLAYHLAVPLDWLQHGARPAPDWLHARLFGLGEGLNLLGLAAGSDGLGAVLQLAGAFTAIAGLSAIARTERDRTLAVAVVAGCPLLAALVMTAKAQLLPAAATTIVIATVIDRRERNVPLSTTTLRACWIALAFAAASKYSFLLSVAPACVVLLRDVWRARTLARGIAVGTAVAASVAAPVFLRNLLWYGDPVSPLLEKFRPHPDLIVATFAAYLRNFEMDHSLSHLVRAPFVMTIPFDPANAASVLGLGALAVPLALACDRAHRDILLAAFAAAALAIVGGQLQARFLLEPMLWGAALVVASRSTVGKGALSWLLGGQMVVTTVAAALLAWLNAPALTSKAGRETVLMRVGADYQAAAWLNRILPATAVVANDQRPVLYLERPSMSGDFARMVDLALLPRETQRRTLVSALRRHHVNTLIVHEPLPLSPFHDLVKDLGPPIATGEFESGSRRFWRRDAPPRVSVYALAPE